MFTRNGISATCRLVLITGLFAATVSSACSVRQVTPVDASRNVTVLADRLENRGLSRIAVIGAAQAFSSSERISTTRLPIDLAALLAGTGDLRVTSANTVRQTVGAGPYDEIMATYTRYGQLTRAQIQRLMAANLPANRALLVRLETDRVEHLPPVRKDVYDTIGRRLADREKHVFTVRRHTLMSAQLLDLNSGEVLWSRQYQVSPETQAAVSRHIGRDFGSSLATSLKSVLVQGKPSAEYPAPTALRDSVMALLQEIAYSVPVN